jgi:thiamine biosynthesis protein ThiS
MEIIINGTRADLPRRAHVTIHELLKMLSIEHRSSMLTVTVNSVAIPQSKWLKEGAKEGDVVEITTD